MNRRYDIDWLRVIAIGLLLIYHITIIFQPWAIIFGFIRSEEPLEALWIPMALLNVWRIPLLFFVSGMGVCFAIARRNWKQLLLDRAKRILLPFIFGFFFIVPLHMFVFQKYYDKELTYLPNPGHLWFLVNIFIYVLLLSPLLFYLKRHSDNQFFSALRTILKYPFSLYLIIIPFVLEAELIDPEFYSLYAFTDHGFWLGLLAFFFGFCFTLLGDVFWNAVVKIKYPCLIIASILYLVRLIFFQLNAPHYLTAIESMNWLFAIFGLGYTYLNYPSKILIYLSQAAYPIYIIHMLFLYLASYLILPLNMSVESKLLLIILLTFFGCFILYDLFIKRINFIT